MPAWPLLLIVIVGFITLILIVPVRVELKLCFHMPRGAEGNLRIVFLWGLYILEYTIELNIQEPARFLLFYPRGGDPNVVWRLGEKEKDKPKKISFPVKQIWPHISIRLFSIAGEVGVKENAYYTAMLSGLVKVLLQCLTILLCHDKKKFFPDVAIAPAFNRNEFLINLEGIAMCSPIHIITAIGIYGSKTRKGKKTAWRILSKTS